MCDHEHYSNLEDRVDSIDARLTSVESVVSKIRSECQLGFTGVNTSIANLANEFGTRMNAIDTRLVEEKQRWGETVRWGVKWTVRVILAGCAAAMGVTAYVSIFK